MFIMKCAVIKIVISLIISGICFAAADIGNQLAIMDGPSTKIQSCVAKVIDHILNPTESLAFVIISHLDYIPSRLPNPVTVVDIRQPLPTHYKRYEVNYVIEVESLELLLDTLNILRRSSLWHRTESSKGKFVILAKEEKQLQNIFFIMWRWIYALHIIIIYEDTSKNCPMKVITSNPQAEGNNCAGRRPTVFSNFSCDSISSLEFLKPIRNYNGCPVFIQPRKLLFNFDFNLKTDRVLYNLLAGLKRTLNVTPIIVRAEDKKLASQVVANREIFMSQAYFAKFLDYENGIIFLRRSFIWFGPEPTRISPLKTVFLPFKYDLWIAVLVITILMILIKWLIMKANGYNNNYVNLACAFTDIIGLTFGVSVNRIPNIWSLKLLLGFFLVYVIHIHTAYTSDLINILTEPRYEGKLKNVDDVADRGLPIYIQDTLVNHYFKITDSSSRWRKISKLIIPHQGPQSINVTKRERCNVGPEDTVHRIISGLRIIISSRNFPKRIMHSLFLTNDLSGEVKDVFQFNDGCYFTESLNAVVAHLWESGTEEADAKLNPISFPFNVTMMVSVSESDAACDAYYELTKRLVRPLNLNDLLPIFVILLICYSFCIIIFVAEIFVHKIVARHSNRVVPLNV